MNDFFTSCPSTPLLQLGILSPAAEHNYEPYYIRNYVVDGSHTDVRKATQKELKQVFTRDLA